MLLGVCALPALGQTYGEITGTVADSSGAVIAAVNVTVTNAATNQTRQVTSNDAGAYSVPFLIPGVYSVAAQKMASRSQREPT
jgi:hypothetical protein